jgi:polar amino acid transport system substrate-binding protein
MSDKLEVLAGLRPGLLKDVEKAPGLKILDGKFTAVQQAVGTAKANVEAAAFLADFVEKAKNSGMVQGFIDRHKVKGLSVAPPA